MRCTLVSNKIIQARERLGLTQQQLAEKLCVTNKAVSKWECGVTLPDISLLVPLCRVLGLTVQELLDEYDGKFGNTPGCQTTEDPAQDTLFAAQQHSHYLYIDLKTTSTVSPHLFGHNLEHTRASIMDVSFFMRGSLFSSSDGTIPVPQKLCTESSDCLFIFFTKQICKIICFAGLSLL